MNMKSPRVSISVERGVNPLTHRMQYSHYVGHIRLITRTQITFVRDPSLDGSRTEETFIIPFTQIHALKQIPERRTLLSSASSHVESSRKAVEEKPHQESRNTRHTR